MRQLTGPDFSPLQITLHKQTCWASRVWVPDRAGVRATAAVLPAEEKINSRLCQRVSFEKNRPLPHADCVTDRR